MRLLTRRVPLRSKMQLGGEAYIAAAATLPAAGQAKIQIVVLKSYDRASEYLRRVHRWVLALGLATLLIGLVLAVAISRTVTRPLETLVAGTRALGQGDFDYEIKCRWRRGGPRARTGL